MKFIHNKLPNIIISALKVLKAFCHTYPTCEGCPFYIKYQGCAFRGVTPREYDVEIEDD